MTKNVPFRTIGWPTWMVLGVVAFLGIAHLMLPFSGDQAMFVLGARGMRHGAVLAHAVVALLGSKPRPGAIFVFGDPLIYLAAGRRQAIPTTGWIPDLNSPRLWRNTLHELEDARPVYVYVDHDWPRWIRGDESGREMLTMLRHDYCEGRSNGRGTWYEHAPCA